MKGGEIGEEVQLLQLQIDWCQESLAISALTIIELLPSSQYKMEVLMIFDDTRKIAMADL